MFGASYVGYQPIKNNQKFIDSAISIKLRFSFMPRRCSQSNKLIWFKLGYRVCGFAYYGISPKLDECRWFDKNEFLIIKIIGASE
jgi:hypothetical protein